MKKKFTQKARYFGLKLTFVLFSLLFMSLQGWGQVLYEDFNYATPAYIGGNGNAGSTSNNWTTHSVTTGQTTTIDIQNGSLSYTGLSSSNGNKVYVFGNANATSRDVNRAFTTSATTLYYSALINIIDNSQITITGDYFMHFGATAGSAVTIFGGRLGAKSVNTGANFRFMIQNTSGGTPNFTEFATDMNFGTTYLVVVKFDRSASPTVATLWVNPTSLGGSEPLTGFVSNNSGTGAVAALASICLRNNATTPKANIDEIRVGATWADVTPLGGLSTPPGLTADASNNNVDNSIDITFTDDVTWRGLVTAVKINGTALTQTTDYILSSGNLQLIPSGLNTLLTTAGSKSVTIEATGYSAASVTQPIDAGAATKLGMKTQPTAPAGNGGSLATQPAVYIQDQYGNTAASTATVDAAVGAGTWTLGGVTSVAGIGGTVTYSGLTATSAAAVTGATINFTSGTLTGITSNAFDIPAPAPTLVVSPTTLTGFTYSEAAGPSPEKTFTVSGLNLTNDISIAASTNYEISLGTGGAFVSTNPITLTQTGGIVATTTIYVRLKAGLTAGNYNSEILNITSTGSTPATVTCSGTVTAYVPTLPLVENFDYTVGTFLSANGWTNHNGTSNFITVTSPTLTYPNYLSSGIGNEVTMINGADFNRPFVAQTSGSIYASFIINVSLATAAGDYFIHFGETSGAAVTLFGGRVWIKKDPASSNFAFGVSKSSTPANLSYTGYDYSVGTTYLVVVKHNFVTGANNDNCVLYVNPVLNAVEPTPTLSSLPADDAGTDPSQYVSICLRQGSTSDAPNLKLDGIRIAKVWTDIVGAVILTPSITVNPTSLTGFTYVQGIGPSTEQSFTVSGVNLTDNISIAPPADYEMSTGTGAAFVATNPIVLTHSGGVVNSTTIYVRLKAGLTAGNYNSEQITTTSAGSNNPVVSCSGNVSTPVPILTLLPVSLSGFSTTLGSASASQSYTISGDYLEADVTLTAPANFEISTDDVNFFPGLVLPQTLGNLDGEPKTVYVRIAASAVGGAVSGNITHTSTNLAQVDLTLTGNVYYPEPSNHVSGFTAVSPLYSTVTLTWNDNDGTQAATGYLILANTTGVFTAPVDLVAQNNDYNLGDGSGAANVLHGVQTFTFSGLTGVTHYYFEIYPYTNSGVNINYKVSPAAPATDITTPAFLLPLAAWTFDVTQAAPNTPASVAANYGTLSGSAMLYADGTNGSSTWITATAGNELSEFTGSTVNDPRESLNQLAGASYCPVAGAALSANGKSMVIKFSMTGYENPILTYATRHSGTTAFNSQLWAYSTDGVNFTPFGANLAPSSTSFATKTLDLSTVDALDEAADVYLRITFDGATGTSTNNRLDNIVLRATEVPQTKTLTAKVFIEGLYNAGTGLMNQAQGLSGAEYGTDIADQISVELHNAFAPYDVAYTYNNVELKTDGTLAISTLPGTITGSYYLVIKHRNSIETWSALAVDFSVAGPIDYDFTTMAGQAYGDNMKQFGAVYAIWGGDASADGKVDIDDMTLIDNASQTPILVGYWPQDINGDGKVDIDDMTIIDNNSQAPVKQVMRP